MESDQPVQWQQRLTELLLPTWRHLIDRRGIEGAGAYNFYDTRTRQQRVFLEYELEVAKHLLSRRLDIAHVHEVGSGYGQLVFLLGWNGLKAAGFELDIKRRKTAGELQGMLTLIEPELMQNVALYAKGFPADDVQVCLRVPWC